MDTTKSTLTPEVIRESSGILYRLVFPSSGLFQCSLTGLAFTVTQAGEVSYKILIWDTRLLQPARKLPGGPLFKFMSPQNPVCQLHLPHCEPDPAPVAESLSVANMTDDGMTLIKPLEVNETHVVLETSHLSVFGIVWDIIKRFMNFITKPVKGQILLFLAHVYSRAMVRVFLLPSNVPLREVHMQHDDAKFIQAPSDCFFMKANEYSVLSDPECMIQPLMAHVADNYGPNYHITFEVFLKKSMKEITLMVQDVDKKQVWQHCLQLPASYDSEFDNLPKLWDITTADMKVYLAQRQFIKQVSDSDLNKLLDELLKREVLTDAEVTAAKVKPRADRARALTRTLQEKGAEASATMISIFSEIDPFLCRYSGLV